MSKEMADAKQTIVCITDTVDSADSRDPRS